MAENELLIPFIFINIFHILLFHSSVPFVFVCVTVTHVKS